MTTNLNVCSDPGYLNGVTMRNRFKLLNIPPQRYDNLQNSPYVITNNLQRIFTQDQLNMRRKVEILKYSANNTSTKTNNLTKREKWAQLVNGSSQRRNLPYSFLQKNLIPGTTDFVQICPSGTTIYTPSYASNIPGPITHLHEDPTVPLYMYATNTDNYAIINQEINTRQFNYDSHLTNIYLDTSSTYKLLTSLYIMNINTTTYSFTIRFPINLFISANVKPGITNIASNIFNESITISFINQPLQNYIYFGNDIVTTNANFTVPSLKSVTFDISMNLTNKSFSGNVYIGNYIMNVILNTQPNYIYDIGYGIINSNNNSLININTQNNTNLYDYFENIKYGICMNPTSNNLNILNNCSIRNRGSLPSISTYQLLSVT